MDDDERRAEIARLRNEMTDTSTARPAATGGVAPAGPPLPDDPQVSPTRSLIIRHARIGLAAATVGVAALVWTTYAGLPDGASSPIPNAEIQGAPEPQVTAKVPEPQVTAEETEPPVSAVPATSTIDSDPAQPAGPAVPPAWVDYNELLTGDGVEALDYADINPYGAGVGTAPDPAIPSSIMTGVWNGPMDQPGASVGWYRYLLALKEENGVLTGVSYEPDSGCSYTYRELSRADNYVTVEARIFRDDQSRCIDLFTQTLALPAEDILHVTAAFQGSDTGADGELYRESCGTPCVIGVWKIN